jgi:hypothetical protein
VAVELGGVVLDQLTDVQVRERTRIRRHPVPGLSGDLSQVLGRSSVEVRLRGIFFGPDAQEKLEALREQYLEAKPTDFSADGVGEGYVSQVLITGIESAQRAGYLDQFDFELQVIEYVEPPEPVADDPFGALDAGLLGDAMSMVDDIQDTLAAATALIDAIANFPSFGDPTEALSGLLDEFTGAVGEGSGPLSSLGDLF